MEVLWILGTENRKETNLPCQLEEYTEYFCNIEDRKSLPPSRSCPSLIIGEISGFRAWQCFVLNISCYSVSVYVSPADMHSSLMRSSS